MSQSRVQADESGPLLIRAVKRFVAHDMPTYAAAIAYQVLFALFPFVIFLVTLLGFLGVPSFFAWFREQAALVLPGQAMAQVNRVLQEIQTPQGGILSIGIILALWSASGATRGLMNVLNRAYGVEEDRPAWKRLSLSVIATIGIAAMLLVAAGLMIIGPEVMTWAASQIGLEQLVVTIWNWVRWPIAALLLMTAIATIYAVLPNTDQPFRFITPGSTFAVIIWIASSLAFGYYVQHIANYNATYGSLGSVVMLLFYFYLSAAVLLLGAEINGATYRTVQREDEAKTENQPLLRERAVGQKEG